MDDDFKFYKKLTIEIMRHVREGKNKTELLSKENLFPTIQRIQKMPEINYSHCYLYPEEEKDFNLKRSIFQGDKVRIFNDIKHTIEFRLLYGVEYYKKQSNEDIKKCYATLTNRLFFSNDYNDAQMEINRKNKQENKNKLEDLSKFILNNSVITGEFKEDVQQNLNLDEDNKWLEDEENKDKRIKVASNDNGDLIYFFFYFKGDDLTYDEVLKKLKGLQAFGQFKNKLKELDDLVLNSRNFYTMTKLFGMYNRKLKELAGKFSSNKDDYRYSVMNPPINKLNNAFGNKIDFKKSLLKSSIGIEPSRVTENLNEIAKYFNNNIPHMIDSECRSFVLPDNESIHMENKEDIENLNIMNLQSCNRIDVDKGNNSIDFSGEGIEKIKFNEDLISKISNVIINSNMEIKNREENTCVLLGPKVDDSEYFRYKYYNDNSDFYEPQYYSKKFNDIPAKGKRDLICLQIFQVIYQISKVELLSKFSKRCNNKPDINPEKDLEFYLEVEFLKNKRKKLSKLIKPVENKDPNKPIIIEFNLEFNVVKTDIEKGIQISLFCIPSEVFKTNQIESNKFLYVDFLQPDYFGTIVFSENEIDSRECTISFLNKNTNQKYEGSYMVYQMFEEKDSEELPTSSFEGCDYNIGGQMHVKQSLERKDFNLAMLNPLLTGEVKDKFYNVNFSDDSKFLFRPPPNMSIDEFKDSIKDKNQIDENTLNKIIANAKYTFLPYCEMKSKDNMENSDNLKCVDDEDKEAYKDLQENEWIYSSKKLYFNLFTKNLGINYSSNYVQYNYFTGKNQVVEGNKDEDIKLINENQFNILDMNQLRSEYCEGFDNYEWKLQIKFRNEEQQNIFLKLLIILRNKVNLSKKIKNDNEIKKISSKKILNRYIKKNNLSIIHLWIKSMEFNNSFSLNEDKSLKIKVLSKDMGSNLISEEDMGLINKLNMLKDYNYKNSILNTEDLNILLEIHKDKIFKKRNPIIGKPKKNQKNNQSLIGTTAGGKDFNFKKEVFNSGKGHIKCRNTFHMDYLVKLKDFENKENKPILNFIFTNKKGKEDIYYADMDFGNIKEDKVNIDYCIIKKDSKDEKNKDDSTKGIIDIRQWIVEDNEDSYDKAFEKSPLMDKENVEDSFIEDKKQDKFCNLAYLRKPRNEPNILRRKIISAKRRYETNIQEILLRKGVLPKKEDVDKLQNNEDTNFHVDKELKKKRKIMKKFEEAKRNEFENKLRDKELAILRKKNLTLDAYLKNNNSQFPYNDLEETIKDDRFENISFLGWSNKDRVSIWNLLLNVNELVKKTAKEIKENGGSALEDKKSLYDFIKKEVDDNKNLNSIDLTIDADADLLFINEDTTSKEIQEIAKVKEIAKCYYHWCLYNVTLESDKYTDSEFTGLLAMCGLRSALFGTANDENKKYVYFLGLLQIIYRLIEDFKEEEIFWILVGLSQNNNIFRQSEPLFDEYTREVKDYVLICRLSFEKFFPEVHKKLASLNYPIDKFFEVNATSFFSYCLKGKAFLRFLDVLLFIKRKNKYPYISVLVATCISLISENKRNINACQSASELYEILNNIKITESNIYRFIMVINNFKNQIFSQNNLSFQKFKDIKNDSYVIFDPVDDENDMYYSKLNKNLHLNIKIDDYYDQINNSCSKIKKLYGTEDKEAKNEKFGIMIYINKLISVQKRNNLKNQMYVKFCCQNEFKKNEILGTKFKPLKLKINAQNEYNNVNEKKEDLFLSDKLDTIKKFANIILFEEEDNNNDICEFSFDITKADTLKIGKETLESIGKDNEKIYMEITYYKYCLNADYFDSNEFTIYDYLFSKPANIAYSNTEKLISGVDIDKAKFAIEIKNKLDDENKIKSKIISSNKEYADLIKNYFNKINNYKDIQDECNKIIKDQTLFEKDSIILELLGKILNDQEKDIEIVLKWLKERNISFEEVLYSLVLIDTNYISIYQKLQTLYSIAQIENKILRQSPNISVKKVKELIYIIYKRFKIYFFKSDVDRMVDFELKSDKIINIKYALVYQGDDKGENLMKLKKIITDSDRYEPNMDLKYRLEEDQTQYDDITPELNGYINYLRDHFDIRSINQELLQSTLGSIIANSERANEYRAKNFNRIYLVICKDNIQYNREFSVEFGDKRGFFWSTLIATVKELNNNVLENLYPIKSDKDNAANLDPNNDIYNSLITEGNNLEVTESYNNNKDEIDFDKFINVVFNLPYITDLLRSNTSFLIENMKDQKIQQISQLHVFLLNPNNDLNNREYFVSSKNINVEQNKLIICPNLSYSMSILDICNFIYSKKKNNCGMFSDIVTKDRSLFYAKIEVRDKNKEENIRLEDCLGSSNLLLEMGDDKNAGLYIYYLDYDKRKKKKEIKGYQDGFAKIFLENSNSIYEWRKCKIDGNKVNFNSNEYPCYLKSDEGDYIPDIKNK